jgi:hypothetical protein
VVLSLRHDRLVNLHFLTDATKTDGILEKPLCADDAVVEVPLNDGSP